MPISKKNQSAVISDNRQLTSNSRNELNIIQQGNFELYDARLLHKDLQVNTKFEDWIKRRITDYKFENGVDYFSNLRIVPHSKKPVTEYLLTMDMCKELGMLERTEIGRAIRKRFIQKEKELRGISQLPRQQALFSGLKSKTINGRRLYPYKELRERCGYSTKGSSANHKNKYPQHFVLMGNLLFVTDDFALHLHHSKQVIHNRATLKAMQPVLALNFGEGTL